FEIDARIQSLPVQQASDHQSRSNHENQRERDFSHNEGVSQPTASNTAARTPSGLLQTVIHAGFRKLQSRSEAEKDARHESYDEQREKRSPIHGPVYPIGNSQGSYCSSKPFHADFRKNEPKYSS